MRNLTLERKIPLIMTGVLATTLILAMTLAYREVRRSATVAAVSRLGAETHQMAELSQAFAVRHARLMATVSNDAYVRQSARSSRVTDVRLFDVLHMLLPATDSASSVAILDNSANALATLGPPVDSTARYQLVNYLGSLLQRRPVLATTDSVHYTPMFVANGHVYYWVVSPIIDSLSVMGHVVELRRMDADNITRINNLVADQTSAYLANNSGTVWVDMAGNAVPGPATAIRSSNSLAPATYNRSGVSRLATMEPIRATPWKLVLETSQSYVESGAHAILLKFVALGFILLILSGLVTLVVTKQITRPLHDLAQAVCRIAAGDYQTRVTESGKDEVGQLASSINTMAAEIGRSHTTLADARQAADMANRAKSTFLATMSHEIRTPINAIIGYTEILDLKIGGPLTPNQEESVERIRSSSSHLLTLVNELLDLAKIEAGSMAIERRLCTLQGDVDAAMAIVHPQIITKNMTVNVSCRTPSEQKYLGDSRAARQALINLLSNAIKFTPPNGTITITCFIEDPYVAVSVQDTGMGISLEDQRRLFQPFTQLENSKTPYARNHGGAGLGLSITRSLVQLMGGDVRVESILGSGSTFTILLPKA